MNSRLVCITNLITMVPGFVRQEAMELHILISSTTRWGLGGSSTREIVFGSVELI